jgi:hypothetical protein
MVRLATSAEGDAAAGRRGDPPGESFYAAVDVLTALVQRGWRRAAVPRSRRSVRDRIAGAVRDVPCRTVCIADACSGERT